MTPSSGHCTFCDLIRGAAEVSIVYEDATAIAFLDIQPVNPGHVLVVPREHYEVLQDIPRRVGAHREQGRWRLALVGPAGLVGQAVEQHLVAGLVQQFRVPRRVGAGGHRLGRERLVGRHHRADQ